MSATRRANLGGTLPSLTRIGARDESLSSARGTRIWKTKAPPSRVRYPVRMYKALYNAGKPIFKLLILFGYLIWRRERDSNPRYGFPYTHFPGVRLQPLGHPSVATCKVRRLPGTGPERGRQKGLAMPSHPTLGPWSRALDLAARSSRARTIVMRGAGASALRALFPALLPSI